MLLSQVAINIITKNANLLLQICINMTYNYYFLLFKNLAIRYPLFYRRLLRSHA